MYKTNEKIFDANEKKYNRNESYFIQYKWKIIKFQ